MLQGSKLITLSQKSATAVFARALSTNPQVPADFVSARNVYRKEMSKLRKQWQQEHLLQLEEKAAVDRAERRKIVLQRAINLRARRQETARNLETQRIMREEQYKKYQEKLARTQIVWLEEQEKRKKVQEIAIKEMNDEAQNWITNHNRNSFISANLFTDYPSTTGIVTPTSKFWGQEAFHESVERNLYDYERKIADSLSRKKGPKKHPITRFASEKELADEEERLYQSVLEKLMKHGTSDSDVRYVRDKLRVMDKLYFDSDQDKQLMIEKENRIPIDPDRLEHLSKQERDKLKRRRSRLIQKRDQLIKFLRIYNRRKEVVSAPDRTIFESSFENPSENDHLYISEEDMIASRVDTVEDQLREVERKFFSENPTPFSSEVWKESLVQKDKEKLLKDMEILVRDMTGKANKKDKTQVDELEKLLEDIEAMENIEGDGELSDKEIAAFINGRDIDFEQLSNSVGEGPIAFVPESKDDEESIKSDPKFKSIVLKYRKVLGKKLKNEATLAKGEDSGKE